jgi:hypothetical protein
MKGLEHREGLEAAEAFERLGRALFQEGADEEAKESREEGCTA